MKSYFGISIRLILLFSVLTGVVYPLAVTLVARGLFSEATQGSLIRDKDQVIGSKLLAQKFESPRYFWPRPSASDFGTIPSGASNAGPLSKSLSESVAKRTQQLQSTHGLLASAVVPPELVLASGSGLDPDLSPEAALFQVNRVAQARNLSDSQREALRGLVQSLVEGPQLGFLGQARVNVLVLNRELNARFSNGKE